MRRVSAFAALVLPLLSAAAPRLAPQPDFVSVEAEGKYVIVGRIPTEQFVVTFSVVGPKRASYSVELYVEGNGTGERAILVQSGSVAMDESPGSDTSIAKGRLEAGTRDAGIKCVSDLPNVGRGEGWAFCLVLKNGDTLVARTTFAWVKYAGPR